MRLYAAPIMVLNGVSDKVPSLWKDTIALIPARQKIDATLDLMLMPSFGKKFQPRKGRIREVDTSDMNSPTRIDIVNPEKYHAMYNLKFLD